jgi:ribosomal-protein-alanine N-acetyltransferase
MELEIFTERLRLIPFVADDIDLALEMWTDPDVVKYICDVMTEAEIRQEMPNSTKRGGNGGIGLWCVADRRTGEKLGDSYLLPLPIDLDDTDFSLVVMGQMPDAEIEIEESTRKIRSARAWSNAVLRQRQSDLPDYPR